MKKKTFVVWGMIGSFIVLVCMGYLFLASSYRDVFPAFLWVNGVYCTGKTPAEVNEILKAQDDYHGVVLMDRSGETLYIRAEDIDYEYSYIENLTRLQRTRGGIYWGKFLLRPTHVTERAFCDFDKEKVDEAIANWDALKETGAVEANITHGEDGYEFEPKGSVKPNMDEIRGVTYNALNAVQSGVDLSTASTYWGGSCYIKEAETDQEREIGSLFEKIDYLQNRGYELEFAGSKITLSKGDISGFILTSDEYEELFVSDESETGSDDTNSDRKANGKVVDDSADEKDIYADQFIVNKEILTKDQIIENGILEDNGFIVDEDGHPVISVQKLYDYAENLGAKYNTAFLVENYRKGLCEDILINENSKGNGQIVDTEAEFNRLISIFTDWDYDYRNNTKLSLLADVKEYNATERLGQTFIEVDMKNQDLKYFVDGALSMEMPVVTGNINRGRGTPAGLYDVYNKRYHTYLRGVDYVSYVNYWLGVNKGVGIHDANWRSKFGEEIYKRDGSHGCINCPEDQVSVLWEVAEVGTPVILHY